MLGPIYVPGFPSGFCFGLVFPDLVPDFHRVYVVFNMELRHPETSGVWVLAPLKPIFVDYSKE